MIPNQRIEQALENAVGAGEGSACPPTLRAAVRHAVFPGGARVRPRLCLAVSQACCGDDPGLSAAAACAIELLHCASLVHDDLPCFDDSPTRRGQPSVQFAFGESMAVLAGDALIVLAFQTLAAGAATSPMRLAPLVATIAAGVGMPAGIVAGQAWESEARVSLSTYQRAKTGALFAAATEAGAQAAGALPGPWRALGECLGEAYQAADDICDVAGDPLVIGKPTGRDAALLRPSVARELGLEGALAHFDQLVADAVAAVPPCRGREKLRTMVLVESERLVPKGMSDELSRVPV